MIPINCNILLSNGKCVVCKGNYQLVNDTCINTNNELSNCNKHINNTCLRCISSYALGINNNCYKYLNKGCKQYS